MRSVRAVAALGLLSALVLPLFTVHHAHAQAGASDASVPPNLHGPCSVSASIEGYGAVDPSASGGVYTVPLSGSATYQGSIAVTPPEEGRAISGEVSVATPPGIPSITLKSWSDDDAENTSDSGTVTWDLPDILPRGAVLTVSGFHNDLASCSGSIKVKAEGGFFDSPVGPASLALTVLTGAGLLFAGMPVGRGGL